MKIIIFNDEIRMENVKLSKKKKRRKGIQKSINSGFIKK
jgi:hypothetical protein